MLAGKLLWTNTPYNVAHAAQIHKNQPLELKDVKVFNSIFFLIMTQGLLRFDLPELV
jgi:hypothetical protein